MTKWIATSERLPPMGEYVLTWMPSRPWVSDCPAVFAKVQRREPRQPGGNEPKDWGWYEFGPGASFSYEVTHWAEIEPAPRPPAASSDLAERGRFYKEILDKKLKATEYATRHVEGEGSPCSSSGCWLCGMEEELWRVP